MGVKVAFQGGGDDHFKAKIIAPKYVFLHLSPMVKALLNFLLRLVGILPLFMVRGLGRFVGFIFGNVLRHHRTDALDALERSIPELSAAERKRTVSRMYLLQGIHFMEFMWYSLKGIDRVKQVVEIEGREHAEEALQRGKGLIALTAHIGCFELMPMATAAQGYKLSTIVKKIKNEAVNEVVEKLRSHEGLTFLATRHAYRDCLKALRRNEAVGMIIDQNMTRNAGIFVDFFGRPACTSPGLAYMAAQSQAPVVPVFIYRKPDGTFRLKVHPLMEPPPDRETESVRAATQAYNHKIEEAVREAPEQWIWMHRRWNTKPAKGQDMTRRHRKKKR